MFGYFPTYALGNLYAAQFYQQAMADLGASGDGLDVQLARGDMAPLREWLRDRIHRHGQRFRGGELVQVVTGRPLSPQPFVEYLRRKYKPLYGI